MESLPSEIEWNIMKYIRHPTANMIIRANSEYQDYLKWFENLLDNLMDQYPNYEARFEAIKEYEEMTLITYLSNEQKRRHRVNIMWRKETENHVDSDSD